jgi:hypothetical protein
MCAKITLTMMLFIDNGDLAIETVLGGGSEGVEQFRRSFAGEDIWGEVPRLTGKETGLHSFDI